MVRELIDTELETVAGGTFDVNTILTSVSHSGNSNVGIFNAPQTATANSVFGNASAQNVGPAQIQSVTF